MGYQFCLFEPAPLLVTARATQTHDVYVAILHVIARAGILSLLPTDQPPELHSLQRQGLVYVVNNLEVLRGQNPPTWQWACSGNGRRVLADAGFLLS